MFTKPKAVINSRFVNMTELLKQMGGQTGMWYGLLALEVIKYGTLWCAMPQGVR